MDPRARRGAERANAPIIPANFATDTALASPAEISEFLADVERRAFKQAMFATRDEDAALDIVQDAMLKLTEKYADKPAAELPMLFRAHPAEHHPRPFPAPEGPKHVDHAALGARQRRRKRRRFRSARELCRQNPTPTRPSIPRGSSSKRRLWHDRTGPRRGFRRVNAKPFCCVTGRNWTWRKPLPRWGVPKAASRPTAPAPSMPWPACSPPRGSSYEPRPRRIRQENNGLPRSGDGRPARRAPSTGCSRRGPRRSPGWPSSRRAAAESRLAHALAGGGGSRRRAAAFAGAAGSASGSCCSPRPSSATSNGSSTSRRARSRSSTSRS